MASFVNGGAQGSRVEDVAAVLVEIVGSIHGEAAQPIGIIVFHKCVVVKVEGALVALAELLLHGCHILVFGPFLVDVPVSVLQSELIATAFEVGV